MVISNIIGGLGNQMFQVANGLATAQRLKTELKLAVHQFADYSLRDYEMEIFNLPFEFASQKEILEYTWHTLPLVHRAPKRLVNLIMDQQNKTYYKEPFAHVSNDFFDLKGDIYLWGFWNSEKYFISAEKKVRKLFTFPKKSDASVENWSKQIKNANAVSVHVRRGDYASVPKTLAVHGVCSPAYYQRAAHIMERLVDKPTYFVFSDDIKWTRKNIKLKNAKYIEHTGENYEDMRLMSECSHHIIANSTFSWWGAWLNNSKTKRVIAPHPWNEAGDRNDKDVCPKDWILVGK